MFCVVLLFVSLVLCVVLLFVNSLFLLFVALLLLDFYDSGAPIYTDEMPVTDTTILPEDDDVVAMIKELIGTHCRLFLFVLFRSSFAVLTMFVFNLLMCIETKIRPVVLRDGGNILFRGLSTVMCDYN